MTTRFIPAIGAVDADSGMIPLEETGDGLFHAGRAGVESITATGDRKVELVSFHDRTLARVCSSMGYSAYYPLHPARIRKPVRAVLMDLDGTSVKSEEFWIRIIQTTVASLRGESGFSLEQADLPHVSGHSVSEHLSYCLRKYCPEKTLEEARTLYLTHTRFQMREIVEGRGRADAFTPSPGLKDFLLELKGLGVMIGLVTSGLYEKAWPEILSVFRTMEMGDPRAFYDAIITAGTALGKGEVGTLGELSPKPHPWLYAETARVGLGVDFADRGSVVGIEDSGAGVCAIRLAGFAAFGIPGGNILESGTRPLCTYCAGFPEILRAIR